MSEIFSGSPINGSPWTWSWTAMTSRARIIQLSYLIIEGRRVHGKNFYFKAKSIQSLCPPRARAGRISAQAAFRGRAFLPIAPMRYTAISQGCELGDRPRRRRRTCAISAMNLRASACAFPDYPIFCALRHYTEEAHIPLKQNPKVLKPPKLEELCAHFGLYGRGIHLPAKCRRTVRRAGDRPHDAAG